MTRTCVNGHPVADDDAFCGLCGGPAQIVEVGTVAGAAARPPRNWAAIAVAISAVATIGAAVAVIAASGGDGPTVAPSATVSATSEDVASTTSEAPASGACGSVPCTTVETTEVVSESTAPPTVPPTTVPQAVNPGVVTQPAPGVQLTTYQHPTLGAMTIRIDGAGFDYTGPRFPAVTATVDTTGQVVYSWQAVEQYETFGFAGTNDGAEVSSPVDGRGNVLFVWNPGRFNGVSLLVPTTDGFTDADTLDDSAVAGYYYADPIDVEGDGLYELRQNFQICEPTCAGGIYYSYTWTWDGTQFSGPSDPPSDAAAPAATQVTAAAAEQLLRDYLLAAGARDYPAAWAMLSSGYQADYGGYDRFTSFWNGISLVGITGMTTTPSDSSAHIAANLWFDVIGGGRSDEYVEIEVGLVDGDLLITGYHSHG